VAAGLAKMSNHGEWAHSFAQSRTSRFRTSAVDRDSVRTERPFRGLRPDRLDSEPPVRATFSPRVTTEGASSKPGGAATSSDRQLADALVQRRDERAFRELYRRHTPRLYQLVLRMLGGRPADAEDAVQETWIRAAESLNGFRWEAAFPTWLCGIGINVARDALRRKMRDRAVVHEDASPWEDAFQLPVRPAADGDRIDLERAIALLPEGYRAVLVLHDVEGMKHEEIGQLLGISAGTSKSQLHWARKSIRNRLAPAKEENHA
jgi:RNA polymerase sigma-70 factor (ECF subfamily)